MISQRDGPNDGKHSNEAGERKRRKNHVPGLGLNTFWEARGDFVKLSTYRAKHVARRGTWGSVEAGGRVAVEEQWLWFLVGLWRSADTGAPWRFSWTPSGLQTPRRVCFPHHWAAFQNTDSFVTLLSPSAVFQYFRVHFIDICAFFSAILFLYLYIKDDFVISDQFCLNSIGENMVLGFI